jgi:hypothetical protein
MIFNARVHVQSCMGYLIPPSDFFVKRKHEEFLLDRSDDSAVPVLIDTEIFSSSYHSDMLNFPSLQVILELELGIIPLCRILTEDAM